MLVNNNIILLVIVSINIIFFFIGYFYALKNKDTHNISKPKSFFDKNQHTEYSNIDEKKVVIGIETKGLIKQYSDLGDTVLSQENIDKSVNKLKNMKG